MSNEKWKQNIETALSFGVPHISSYALTVEPKTALNKLIQTGKIAKPNDEVAEEHFQILVEITTSHGARSSNCSSGRQQIVFPQFRCVGETKILF